MAFSFYPVVCFCVWFAVVWSPSCRRAPTGTSDLSETEDRFAPHQWMDQQRSYPHGQPDVLAHRRAVHAWQDHSRALSLRNENLTWQSTGPTNIGGRVTDLEMPASSLSTIYVAAAGGGIFKTMDTGLTWTPIFDDYGVLAVGDIALHPQDPSILYAGTGEPNAGGGSITYEGQGIFRSKDGGESWQNIGLPNSGSIGRMVIDPLRPERLFVAAMGSMFAKNQERGIYRSLKGGEQWERVLFVSDSTGGIDLAINPRSPDTIYAAMWERVRRADYREYGGATSGLYRSIDGGSTWRHLTNGLPTLAHEKGRIGVAVAPNNPSMVYTVYATTQGHLQGVYRSENGGESWQPLVTSGLPDPGFMWWFGRIWVHPLNARKIYVAGLQTYMTVDGTSWSTIFSDAHVDQHALFFHPQNPDFMLNGNDGGVYLSRTGGRTYKFLAGLPITQFYTVKADHLINGRVYGGTQDNASMRTNGAPDAWEIIWVGDGFATFSDPTNANFVYTTSQYGYFVRSTNGGRQFTTATQGISPNDRRNWNTPAILDPAKPFTLYLGTNRMYQSSDRAQNWFPISGDLTHDQRAPVTFNTITTIDVSPLNSSRLYCGTDDGRVWVYTGVNQWSEISAGLPKRWVTRVVADPRDYPTVFVTLSGYRWGEKVSHVYKSINSGDTWQSIGDDLPDVPVNDLVVIASHQLLVVATDAGVYYSSDEGTTWEPLGQGLPPVVVNDLDYKESTKTLYAGTYGRSIMQLNLTDLTTTKVIDQPAWTVTLYPLPAQDQVFLRLETPMVLTGQLSLMDLTGRLIWSEQVTFGAGQSTHRIPLHNLPGGTYYAQLSDNHNKKTFKVLKR